MGSASYESRLIGFALKALEEAAARAHSRPVHRSWALRLALAYLSHCTANAGAPAAWAFELFWRSLEEPKVHDRWGKLNTALNGIYVALGQRRELTLVSRFEQVAREEEATRGRNCSHVSSTPAAERSDTMPREFSDSGTAKHFVRRGDRERLEQSTCVSRSLSADRSQHAKTEAKKGEGGRGDL
jgi:hypothetical protein